MKTKRITKDSPFVFLTSVTHNRLPVFATDKMKRLLCEAFDEARRSGGIDIFAYVIMPDHYHVIAHSDREPSAIARYLNGISARRVIGYLKENNFVDSLAKLRTSLKESGWKHSLWQHHPNQFLITSEGKMMEKVNYIHLNPVRAGFVERPEDYLYSSARIWMDKPLPNEPLSVDIDKILWREA